MTSPSSSQSFWAAALALEPEVLGQQTGPPSDLPCDPPGGAGDDDPTRTEVTEVSRGIQSRSSLASVPKGGDAEGGKGLDPYEQSARRARYMLDEDDTPPAKRQRRSPSPGAEKASSPPLSSPTLRHGTNTNITILPGRRQVLTDEHSYLQAAEYAPNAFGDIADYLRKKKIKVQTQNAEIAAGSTGQPQIFAGMSFYINGNTSPPMEVLRRMILQRGGIVHPWLRAKSEVDYVIAPVLTIKKYKDIMKGGKIRIVREEWIVKCCDEGRVLDWRRWRYKMAEGESMEGFLGTGKAGELVEKKVEEKTEAGKAESPVAADPVVLTLPPAGSLLRPLQATQAAQPRTRGSMASTQFGRATQAPQPLRRPAGQPAGDMVDVDLQPPPQTAVAQDSEGELVRIDLSPSVEGLAATVDPLPAPGSTNTTPKKSLATTLKSTPKTTPKRRGEKGPEGSAWSHYALHESNPHAQQLMKSEAFRAQNTSEQGADFIDKFYQNSRLHYLSTWKAEMRVLVGEARSLAVRVPTVLTAPGSERVIFHVDFDAFFVSAGIATRPELKGKMCVVCHSSSGDTASTSEIASASYEARAKGVKNGMSLGRARQLCGPELQTIPYEFETYKKFSLQFYTVLQSYADELEAVSVDEALMDATGAVTACSLAPQEAGVDETDPALQVADKIRSDIRAATGCEVSIGVSHNILLAKLATRRAKPAGIYHLTASEGPAFLAELDVEELPSVGWSTRKKLDTAFNTTSCGKLLSQPKEMLQRALGPKTGEMLYNYLRGIDTRLLEPDKERKSVSAEINYGIRFRTQSAADAYLLDLAAEVAKRLKHIGAKGRQVTLKIMIRHPEAPVEPPKFMGHGRCETVNKSAQMPWASDEAGTIGRECVRMLNSMGLDPVELRGVGIQITKLEFPGKGNLGGGQKMLSFAKRPKANEESFETVQEVDGEEEEVQGREEEAKEEANVVQGDATVPASPVAAPAVASSDSIDPSFLAALPADLRREVEVDHATKRAAKRQRSATVEPPVILPAEPAHKSERNPAAHITKQLRPKLKTQLKAGAIAELPLYNAWSRAGAREASRGPRSRSTSLAPAPEEVVVVDSDDEAEQITVGGYKASELRSLGLDLDVFAALPREMQDEVVAGERARRAHRDKLRKPRTRTESLSPGAASRKYKQPAQPAPVVINPVDSRPALFGAKAPEDVARVLATWVHSADAPADKDVARVEKYFLKCLNGGLGGLEHVAYLLRSMRGVLADQWNDGEQGGKWEEAFWSLKAGVDSWAVASLGAPLGL